MARFVIQGDDVAVLRSFIIQHVDADTSEIRLVIEDSGELIFGVNGHTLDNIGKLADQATD